MMDQAEKLRQIIDGIRTRQTASQSSAIKEIATKTARVITITSGKGGVGKTNITLNLAIALSELGKRVVILDADLGLANIDVLLGVIPQHTLVELISNKKSILEVLSEGPNNIRFISGGSGVEELIKLDKNQLEMFTNSIAMLDRIADIILIDTGAGLSENVMSFVMAADEVILVTTPEPTSITDAYALIKMVANRNKSKVIKMIVNRAETVNEANDILKKLSIVSQRFLKLDLQPLGYILNDDSVIKSVKLQKPFLLNNPKSQASRYIRGISKKIAEDGSKEIAAQNQGIKGFIRKFVGFTNN